MDALDQLLALQIRPHPLEVSQGVMQSVGDPAAGEQLPHCLGQLGLIIGEDVRLAPTLAASRPRHCRQVGLAGHAERCRIPDQDHGLPGDPHPDLCFGEHWNPLHIGVQEALHEIIPAVPSVESDRLP